MALPAELSNGSPPSPANASSTSDVATGSSPSASPLPAQRCRASILRLIWPPPPAPAALPSMSLQRNFCRMPTRPSTLSSPTPLSTGCAVTMRMMREAHRVLRPGGRFVAEMGGHGNIAAIRVAFIATLNRYGFGDRENDVNYYPTPEAYTARLTGHGFSVEKIALIPRPTPLGEEGMQGWLRTFRRGVLDSLPLAIRETVIDETCALLAQRSPRRGRELDRRLRAPSLHRAQVIRTYP